MKLFQICNRWGVNTPARSLACSRKDYRGSKYLNCRQSRQNHLNHLNHLNRQSHLNHQSRRL